ncbi:NADH-quinone oxidoreductase subunit NuoG [Nitrosococcus watsonii]|uniref:NADH-quinone oxidoreductase n=1 Tax=Nitrosococcus watsoni (strain C-113) TaxID=105559 RepID=D8K775_NITWC|nr:NADH-quinone oxidoreductase subunit NuoG [Nitrosococcus watsonii]ADJ28752.1 NADH-quinone oxidoreductase, chain G [Nitrosococcus watsonii C-113]
MAKIYIDNQEFEVEGQNSLLQTCLSLGFNLPYFCWHPALGSVGACRQCAVKQFKDEQDTQGRLVMSCMTPVSDGARISIKDPEAKAFRASVIEWLMTNHPHDCPVCEEGGECHLQDMTVLTGHTYRRFRFKKRTFTNQYLGPFLNHEMNRCIACYRCVRFYQDYAGGEDLQVFNTHHHVYFGRHEDGILDNEFSGNLAEVCPTGVFTDKPFSRHYTRKWDLRGAPSVCIHCSLGCNTTPNERYGRLKRTLNRYNHQVNGYFLCDRGRFGGDFVNNEQRLRQPRLHKTGNFQLESATQEQALHHVARLITEKDALVGIGSPRASLEANFALRTLVGPERFYSGLSEPEEALIATAAHILQNGPARIPSLQEVEQADAILVLGEDLLNTAPRLALSLRQAVRQASWGMAEELHIPSWQDLSVREAAQQQKSPLFIATSAATGLDELATQIYRGTPADLARLGFAIAYQLDPKAPAAPTLTSTQQALADSIAKHLKQAQRPLIISGTSSQSQALLQAAANVAWALSNYRQHTTDLYLTLPECNSLGLHLLNGVSLDKAFKTAAEGKVETAIILENDLYRRADRATVETFLKQVRQVVVIDHLCHDTMAQAEIALPAGTFAESEGTLVSSEGRAQRFFQVFVPENGIQESWRWLSKAMAAAGREEGRWQRLDEITRACAETMDSLKGITHAAPSARFRIQGMRIPREPHRYSGRTAMTADISVHEPKPPQDSDSPFSFSMEGYPGQPPSAAIPYFWAPTWNSIQSVNKFQEEVGGPLRGGSPGIRLIEPKPGIRITYFDQIPPAFQRREEQWLILPLHHIFGSEMLSALAPAIAERVPAPYLALSPEDGARLELDSGDEVALTLREKTYRLPVRHQNTLPPGTAGIPWGLSALKGIISLPAWGQLSKGTL